MKNKRKQTSNTTSDQNIIGLIIDEVCGEISTSLKNDFLKSIIAKLWDEYMKERKVVIEENIRDAIRTGVPYVKNAKQGVEYNVDIPFDVEGIYNYSIEGLSNTGLEVVLDKEKKSIIIKGIANVSGTYPLTLHYKYKDEEKDETMEIMDFCIIPDPKTLWKNIEVDWENMQEPRYKKDDIQSEYVLVESLPDGIPQMDIVGASKRGRSHAQEGKPRDDDFRLYHDKDTNWYVMTVADGAGSAKYSREGSRLACETVVEQCKTSLKDPEKFEQLIKEYQKNQNNDKEEGVARKAIGDVIYRILGNAALEANKKIDAEANIQKKETKEYATTLLVAIAKRFDFGWFIASFWVGDGAIALYNKGEHKVELLGSPDEGEYAGQTRFLTMPEIFADTKDFYSRLRFRIVNDFTALFLMTDGVSDPMFETDANLHNIDKWDELWDNLLYNEENPVHLIDDNKDVAQELLSWLDFWSSGNHDDRTIVILYKEEKLSSKMERCSENIPSVDVDQTTNKENCFPDWEKTNNEVEQETLSKSFISHNNIEG